MRTNIAANIAGRFYTALAGIVFVPVYLHFLGVSGYGLFALLNSYMAIAGLLDLGFSGAITREIAKLSATTPERMRDLVWTISLPYCVTTVILALAIYVASPWIADFAIDKGAGPPDPEVVRAVGLAGFGLTLQLPGFLYGGGLAGLQRQDIANAITIVSTTLRHGVAVALLWGVTDSVAMLMAWQAVIAAFTAGAAFIALWSRLPPSGSRPRFRTNLLRETWKFAAGLGGLTVLGTVVLQSDKIIIGALLPLSVVGRYMVASVIATNLLLIAQPVASAAFPRLSQLIAVKNWPSLYATCEQLSQLVAVMALPVTTVIAVFPELTLRVWTGNGDIAQSAGPLLRCLAIGVIFNAMASIPYSFEVAMGRTTILFVISVIKSPITLAIVGLGTMRFGPIGAAVGMCAYFVMGFVAVAAVLRSMFRREEWWRWLSRDAAVPSVLATTLALLMLQVLPPAAGRISGLAVLAATWLVSTFAVAAALPRIRQQALWHWQHMRARSLGSTH
ncbi:MAG TPA: oligosaccharide flippase family protein [Stellaceae bacterium]|nr:oligosaccharide flippase family protein [Stellaceae bacterium]